MKKIQIIILTLLLAIVTFVPYTTHAAGEVTVRNVRFEGATASESPEVNQIYQDSLPKVLNIQGDITQIFNELVVRIFNPSGELYYVDVIQPDSGSFDTLITLPANTPAGTYDITIGKDSFQGQATFTVLTRNSGVSSRGGGGSYTPTPDPVKEDDCKPSVTSSSAKKIECEDVDVEIPSNAMEIDFAVTIAELNEQPERSDFPGIVDCNDKLNVLSVFKLTKSKAGQFKKPVKVTFKFDKALAENRVLSLFYYDKKEDIWVQLKNEIKDGAISATVEDFYKFAIVSVQHVPAFPDIRGHWGEKTIEEAVCLGLIKGYPDGTLKPDKSITRAEFSAILTRALDLGNPGKTLTFNDEVEIGAWVREDVGKLLEIGLVKGFNDGTFRPQRQITRSEIGTIIGRAMNSQPDQNPKTSFVDDQLIPTWAKGYVAEAEKRDVIRGRNNNMFEPNEKTTRAEALVLIMRMLNDK